MLKCRLSKERRSSLLTIRPVFMLGSGFGAKLLVVLIGLVIIFKSQLTSLVQTIFEKITSESAGI